MFDLGRVSASIEVLFLSTFHSSRSIFSSFLSFFSLLFSLFFFIPGIEVPYWKDYHNKERKVSNAFFSLSGVQKCVVSRNSDALLCGTTGGALDKTVMLNVA